DAGGGDELDAVTGYGADVGGLDHAGVHGDAHGVQDVTSGQVDGRGAVEGQRDARLVRGDERVDHPVDVAAGQVVRFQLVLVVLVAGVVRLDGRQDVAVRRDAPEPDGHEAGEAQLHARGDGRDPQPDRDDREEDDEEEDHGAG